MTSEFQQFQVDNQQSTIMKSFIGTTMFRNLKLEQETPIFSKFRINYSPLYPITHLIVNNNHLVLAMSNKTLIRIDLLVPHEIEEIDLSKYAPQAKLYKIFLDPTGHHMIISIVSGDNVTPIDVLYLPWKGTKPKVSSKLKGMLISAVGWNPKNTSDSYTGQILVGTTKGQIYELEMTSDEKFLQSGHERNLRQIYDLTQNEVTYIITDLEIVSSPSDEFLFLIFCNTSTRLFQFLGFIKSQEERPLYLSIFQNYMSSGMQKNFIDHPNPWKSSFLQLIYLTPLKVPKSFVWTVGHTIYNEDVSWTDISLGSRELKPSPFPENCESDVSLCGFITTQFHVLLLWPDKIMGLCLLNNQVVFEDFAPEDCGRFVGIYQDIIKGSIWVYCERGIFKYKVEKEDRNVWQIYLEDGNFEMAKNYCKLDEVKLAYIMIKEAEKMFSNKDYIESAKLFAKVPSSFEEVCVKFLKVKAEEALKVFLREKLQMTNPNDQTQITLVILWLIELYLRKLGILRDTDKRNTSEYNAIDEEFKELLRDLKVRQCIHQNSNSIYSLLASHDDQDNYVGVALIMKDFNRVVVHFIAHQKYIKALKVMSTQNSDKLFYQHTPTLLQVIPKETIDALIAQGRKLNPVILLPTLVHAHSSYSLSTEVLKYVEFCVDKLDNKDKVIHNFLITLYCTESSEKLLNYLKLQGEDSESVNYDAKFALRECTTAGHDMACIHILTTIGLYQEAVEMALKVNTSLAKAIASRVRHNQELCKKLWLTIAAHVVQKEQDVARTMEVLKDCSFIKIEDILPFFPNFVTIEHFKDAICKSLEEYNEQIERLKEEMDEATKSANNIRNDIKKFKKNHFTVRAQDRCAECHFPLLTRSFYLFPCSHKFHQDCLTDAVMNSLSEAKQRQVSELKGKFLALASDEGGASRGVGSNFWSEREQLRLKIDAIVASECVYCGSIAVNSVDAPLIPDEEWDTLMEEWQ